MIKLYLVVFTLFMMIVNFCLGQVNVNYSINTSLDRALISPYIYGNNSTSEEWSSSRSENITARRMGGNRLTGYNWENNYSNGGSNNGNGSDTWLCSAIGLAPTTTPGAVIKKFHDVSIASNTYSLYTLQGAGYVAKDGSGTITAAQAAPSLTRLRQVVSVKGSAFLLSPNTTDDFVYTDEMLNWIISTYGNSTAGGINGYCVDNELDLWNSSHSRIHPVKTTCQEVVNKTIEFGRVVKNLDPNAEVFGPGSYGYSGFRTCQNASDWNTASFPVASYPWFLDAYLDKVKAQSVIDGKRLLDVLDIHWYPEAQGADNSNIKRRVWSESPQTYDSHNGVANARMQAPRSLWDDTYIEDSWIPTVDYPVQPIKLIPRLTTKINNFYPGTKLAITEYDFGAEDHISGGIATADALGIFGEYNVYMANYWGPIKNYVTSAFKLFRNYDDNNSAYGDINVSANSSNVVNSSIYASVNPGTDDILHIIVINRNSSQSIAGTFNISSSTAYTSGTVYAFNEGASLITERAAISSITGNSFTYDIPALTAAHIILNGSTPTGIIPKSDNQYFNVYPNPFNSKVTIKAQGLNSEEIQVNIMDLQGTVILSESFLTNEEIVIGDELINGIYMMQIKTNHELEIYKIVKTSK